MALGIWALQFTPRVALQEGAVLAEVSASARLFGGLERLCQCMQHGAAELGARVAWAPTGLAALALVRHGGGRVPEEALASRLDALPLQAMTAVGQHQATLARVGCRTLGQVRRLPRGGLVRRFGAPLLAALDQAYGLRPEAYDWITLPPTFQARLELMARVEHAPALLFGARRLLVQMAGWLARAPLRRAGLHPALAPRCHARPVGWRRGSAHSAYLPAHAKRGALHASAGRASGPGRAGRAGG
jgi:protein ImuB